MNMPNNPRKMVDQESKNATTKVLAIIGSLAVVVIGVWLAVQIVRVLPEAFSSLASIAEDVYHGGGTAQPTTDTFSVNTDKTTMASGDTFTLSWNKIDTSGTYRFRYTCAPGVSIAVRVANADTVNYINCDEIYSFTGNPTSLNVFADSEQTASADIAYVLTFTKDGSDTALGEYDGTITVTNDAIAAGVASEEEGAVTDETTDNTPTTGTSTPAVAEEPEIVYVPYTPVSLENGYTDLRATVVGVGHIDHHVFYPSPVVYSDDDAAIQIEVRNIGTKTSDRWDLDINLPNGEDYMLDNQKGLKPNERAVITIGFDASDEDGFESFDGEVSVDDDENEDNNYFEGEMRFIN